MTYEAAALHSCANEPPKQINCARWPVETAGASSIQSVFHVQPKSSATQGLGFNPLKTHFQIADAPNNPLEVLVHNLYLDQVLLEIRMGPELHGFN